MTTMARDCTEVYRCRIAEGQLPSLKTREISVSSNYDIRTFKTRNDVCSEKIEDIIVELIDRARVCRHVPTMDVENRRRKTKAELYAERINRDRQRIERCLSRQEVVNFSKVCKETKSSYSMVK